MANYGPQENYIIKELYLLQQKSKPQVTD